MRKCRVLTPLTLSTSWQIIPINVPARALVFQCRTAVDALLCTHTDNIKYWTLKSGSSLILDVEGTKYAYAAESTNLIVNGTFTGGSDPWTVSATEWTYGGNLMAKDADGVGVISQPVSTLISDAVYVVTLTMSGYAVSGLAVKVGGGDASATMASDAAHTQYVIAGSTVTGLLELVPTAAASRFSVDTVLVYLVTGPVLLAKVAAGTPTLEIMALI